MPKRAAEGGSEWAAGDSVLVDGRAAVVARDMRPKHNRATVTWSDTGEIEKKIDADTIRALDDQAEAQGAKHSKTTPDALKVSVPVNAPMDGARERIEAYLKDPEAGPVDFPPSLAGEERAMIHQIAQELGLRASSQGDKQMGTRYISVRRMTEAEQQAAEARQLKLAAAKAAAADTASAAGVENPAPVEPAEWSEPEDVFATLREQDDWCPYKALHIKRAADGLSDKIAGGEARVRGAYHRCVQVYYPKERDGVFCDSCGSRVTFGNWHHRVAPPADVCSWCKDHREAKPAQQKAESGEQTQAVLWREITTVNELGDAKERYAEALEYMQQTATELRKFWRANLSFALLKDQERRRIYNDHGWSGLRKSEAYQDWSVFDICPYRQNDDFFAGVDPADREYLMMNGPNALSDQEEDSDEEEDEAEEEVWKTEGKAAQLAADFDEPPPKPPASVSVSTALSNAVAAEDKDDVWSEVAKKIQSPQMVDPSNLSNADHKLRTSGVTKAPVIIDADDECPTVFFLPVGEELDEFYKSACNKLGEERVTLNCKSRDCDTAQEALAELTGIFPDEL